MGWTSWETRVMDIRLVIWSMLQMGWGFHGPEHGMIYRFLMSSRCSRSQWKTCDGIRMCILMVWAYGWTDHPTSSSHGGYSSVQRCVSIVLEYHGSSSHDENT